MNTEKFHQSQRGYFAGALHEEMGKNPNIWLLTGDLGFKMLDSIRDDFPDRFLNCGASEQAMLGIAVGLAQEGKIVFAYTITSFFLRAAETINLYLHHEGVPVRLVGSGRDDDYKHDGYSHDAKVIQNYIRGLNIRQYWPESNQEAADCVKDMLKFNDPSFISLRR